MRYLGLIIAIVIIPSLSLAEHITVNFLAVITEVNSAICQCIPYPSEMIGDTLQGSYTYDVDSPDSDPSPFYGRYEQTESPSGIEVHHKSYSWGSDPTNVTLFVYVQDSTTADAFEIRGYNNLPDPFMQDNTYLIYMSLWEYSGNAISSDTMPSYPPQLDEWTDAKEINIIGPGGEYYIYSDLIWIGFGDPQTGINTKTSKVLFLGQNHPNPFTNLTSFQYHSNPSTGGNVSIYDVNGRVVVRINIPPMDQGTVSWNGLDLRGQKVPSGVYFYKFMTNNQSITKKMIILR